MKVTVNRTTDGRPAVSVNPRIVILNRSAVKDLYEAQRFFGSASNGVQMGPSSSCDDQGHLLQYHRVRAAPEFLRIPAREQVARLHAVADLDGEEAPCSPTTSHK